MKKTLFLCIATSLMLVGCGMGEKKNAPQDLVAETTTDQEAATVVTEGKVAPDFTLNGPDGKPVSLSSLRGQYVVLDFWGTWCKWCVKGIPDMKRYYDKYEGLFEILSIDFGDDEDTWLNAIEKFDMTWKHVITDEESARQLEEAYALEGFPTKIVIDPKGVVLNISVGEDPAFYKYIDDLFEH